jgi:protein-tyrosine phosphatase
MKQVLFLCTANYYRSRFAEHLFNWLAEQERLPWKADSCGVNADLWQNIGPISCHTIEAMRERGIPVPAEHRCPKQLTLAHLAAADLVIAVKEAEHRAMMTDRFPEWTDRIEYWHVDDLDCAQPEKSLPHLEANVRALLKRLRCESEGEEKCRAA